MIYYVIFLDYNFIMIVKEKQKYIVKSESGKPLSKPYHKKSDAVKRLRQIEYFKEKNK